jgi:hypothetical protein
MKNRPDVSSNKLLNKITSTDDGAGKMEHTFAIPDTRRSVIVLGGANSSQ